MNFCVQFDAQYFVCADSVRKKRNFGIEHASLPYILFLDSDVIASPGLLTSHAETWMSNQEEKELGGTFGVTEFSGLKNYWWRILELTTFTDSFGFAKKYPYVSWCIGNNVSFRKSVLFQVGKFEENLPFKLGGDDLDLSYRITKANYLIKCVPTAVTYHSTSTWNHWRAIHDRAKRWGTMEYYLLKRHPELAHNRLPMTGDVIAFFTVLFYILSFISKRQL